MKKNPYFISYILLLYIAFFGSPEVSKFLYKILVNSIFSNASKDLLYNISNTLLTLFTLIQFCIFVLTLEAILRKLEYIGKDSERYPPILKKTLRLK